MAVFPSRPVGGSMARRLLPVVIGLQVLLGWLCLSGHWAGLYDTAFGVALLVVANGIIFATLVWWTAGVLSRLDAERRQTEETLQHEAQITAVLARMRRELTAALKTPSLLDRLCRVTVEELGCDRSGVVLWQPKEKVYRVAAGYGYTPEQWERLRTLKLSPEALGSVMAQLEEGEVVEVRTDTPQGPVTEVLFRELGTTATLCVGLWQGQELIGCQTAAYQGRTEFTPSQRRIARGIAQLASVALNNARLLERAQSADRIKTAFLNAISHKLRTPFHVILGYTDLLLNEEFGPLNVEQTNTLGRVRQAARGLFELVSTLLEASQLETRRPSVEMAEVDGDAFLAELRQEAERLQVKPGLRWEWRVASGLPRLYTDRTKLKVILKNLLSNAVKFTPEGTVTVVVQPQRGGVEFCVSDTGIGIAPEGLSVVFKPFQQGDESLTRHYEGVGLGLHIVKRLVEVLGGTISVESVVGHGSTFRVWLPAGGAGRLEKSKFL